jgi:hypothetical protein
MYLTVFSQERDWQPRTQFESTCASGQFGDDVDPSQNRAAVDSALRRKDLGSFLYLLNR